MSAPAMAENFMQSLSRRVFEFSIPELFRGSKEEAKNRLALDFVIPIQLATSQEYDLRLVANLRHVKNDHYFTHHFWVSMTFCSDDILIGPLAWEGIVDSFAYQLVAALQLTVRQLGRPTFIIIQPGDIHDLLPNMKRIWIA